jgi:hypothetical protein
MEYNFLRRYNIVTFTRYKQQGVAFFDATPCCL